MRHSRAAGQSVSAETSYSPSVPISLYREVSSELQATKAAMESVKNQNRQLLQQNQQLRQEIDRLAKLVMYTQEAVSHLPSLKDDPVEISIASISNSPFVMPGIAEQFTDPTIGQSPVAPKSVRGSQAMGNRSGKLVTKPVTLANPRKPSQAVKPSHTAWVMEQPSHPSGGTSHASATTGTSLPLSGWKLAILIPLIVLTAFGAGFLLVRPLLSSK